MNTVMTLGDQVINDLAILAVTVAFCAVVVVATLWTAAYLRVDKALQVASRDLGPAAKTVIACIMMFGTGGLLLGALPSALLTTPWAGAAAACWVIGSLVALSAASVRTRPAASIAKSQAQDLPTTIGKAA